MRTIVAALFVAGLYAVIITVCAVAIDGPSAAACNHVTTRTVDGC